MRRAILGSLIGLSLTGCSALKPKYDNPVFAAAPRRIATEAEAMAKKADSGPEKEDIITVSATEDLPTVADMEAETKEFNSSIVATVNGAPVFASEILEQYGGPLQQARQKIIDQRDKVPPEKYLMMVDQYKQFRDQVIQNDLRSHIERRLLIELLKSEMKADQIKSIQTQLDKQFEEVDLPKLKRDLKVTTKPELEREMMKRDTSLAAVRNSFHANTMAVQYVRSNITQPEEVTRKDTKTYYDEHIAEFETSARVTWRQIQCSFKSVTDRDAAEKKIRTAHAELQSGAKFGDVALKYSDDPVAKEGGVWDWIKLGSLADKSVESRLFALPIGRMSGIIETKGAFLILEVIDREEAGVQPYEKVQHDIKAKLQKERQAIGPREFLKKTWDAAVIETKYDLAAGPQQRRS